MVAFEKKLKHDNPTSEKGTPIHLSKEILTETDSYEIYSSAGLSKEKACPVKCLPNEMLSLFHRGLFIAHRDEALGESE